MKVRIVLNDPEEVWNAFRFGNVALKENHEVRVFLVNKGVEAEDIKSEMFTPMFTTKSKGQGFGLAVVKRMTEALGGTVSFESKVSKGTKFTIELPITQNNQ